jgi:SHS2 domain-containing protein
MESKNWAGYEEVRHTADWALRVWAPDPVELMRQAAAGMQALMGVKLTDKEQQRKPIDCSAGDLESLLVAFLNEILYWIESEGIACEEFDLALDGCRLSGTAICRKISSLEKEIKAVTFHNLAVRKKDDLFETTIVFDV